MPRRLSSLLLAPVALAAALAVGGSALAAPPSPPDFQRPVDAYAPYEGQTGCAAIASPGVIRLQELVLSAYPQTRHRGHLLRSCNTSGTSEHEDGRAWDWPVNAADPAEKAMADEFLAWLTAPDENGTPHAQLRRLGIMYVIWNEQVFKAYGTSRGWQPYVGASPHTDHVHFSLSHAGARQTTSWGLRFDAPTPGIALHADGLTWLVRDRAGTPVQGLWQPKAGAQPLGSPGGVLVGGLAVGRLSDGSLVVAGRGRDDALYVNKRPPGAPWQGWVHGGAPISSRPALVGDAEGGFDVGVRGSDGRMWTTRFDAAMAQAPWTPTGSPLMREVSAPGITYVPGSRLEQVVLAADGWPWRRSRVGSSWTSWARVPGGQFKGDVSLAASSDGLVLALRGLNDQAYVRTIGAQDTGWVGHGGILSSSPAVAASWASPRVDYVIYGTDDQLWRTTGSRSTWSPWHPVGRV